MSEPVLSRRAFLAAGGGVLVAAAAGGAAAASGAAAAAPMSDNKKLSALLLASDLYASPNPQRIAFALSEGPKYASGPSAKLAYGQSRKLGAAVDTVLHSRGLPKRRGIYTAEVTLPQAGPWLGVVQVKKDGKRQNASLAFQVQDQPQAPVAGAPAPRAASPTVANPLGVDPICTRSPQCPLHDVSLDTVIGAGKPVAVMLATPALCQSRYCGPTLDDLLTLTDQYKDRITFAHVEIYTNMSGNQTTPTVQAWGIQTEPWLFGVDATGTVVSRLDGAFGHDEQQQLLQQLVS
jgi:hypothetical protein